jgi:uncharacterized repeat protein (TIGR02543 family)
MLKKKNLLFFSLLILGIFLLSSCFLNPPVTEGILKGQVMVPEDSSVQNKDLNGQALPDATVNIIDLETGVIIATTVTDTNGTYQFSVLPGGPYLLEAIKDGVKLQQITCPVEVGIEYDLGTMDCVTTAVALIAQAMMDAEDYPNDPTDINLADIKTDPNFNNVMSDVCSVIEAAGDPITTSAIQEAVENFLYPPAPVPAPTPTPTYTVIFDSQNGSAIDSQTVAHGGKVTEPADPIREDYTFGGWFKESGCTDDWIFATDKVTANITLYAKWTINSYTVTFKKNGGDTEANPTTKTVAHGGNVGTLPTEPTRAGYAFATWNTQAGGGGPEFTETTAVNANLTVYAQWTANNYNITFDKNDDAVTETMIDQTIASGLSAALTACAFTKTGWTFAGWAETSTGEVSYTDEASYTMGTFDVTLYAKWTPPETYAIGDRGPAGGWIFYDQGSYANFWRYLEAAPSDQSTGTQWGCYGTSISGADGTLVGTGKQNTIDIEAGCTTPGAAADICANLSLGGYSDWFLPSLDELNLMYENLKLAEIGGFGVTYWSSSELSANTAYYQNFDDGNKVLYWKDYAFRVRAVRAF